MPRHTWYRVVALQRWRGRLGDDAAWRMVRHLTHHTDERGRLVDVPSMIAFYAAVHQVSSRTAWTDLRRVRQLGYVRQTAAAAPGRAARYVLSVPELPADAPTTLGTAIRAEIDPPARRARGRLTRAQAAAVEAEVETVRYGSAAQEPLATATGCGWLQTSPYSLEGFPPSPDQRVCRPRTGPRGHRRGGGVTPDEQAEALYLVKECGLVWARQGQALREDQVPGIAHLIALVRRHLPHGEVLELLGERVASAADLASVITYRAGRVLATARRARRVQADEDGQGYAVALAARAAAAEDRYEQTQRGRSLFATARAELEAARIRRRGPEPSGSSPSTRPTTAAPSGAEPVAEHQADSDVAWLADATRAIQAAHRQRGTYRL
ncbi:hypothetical protein [Streptosporangium saharense]|uniref:Uncharacterized protein n=1 Tax=Streptosporangium saharense TaxID=1706840 RepID=A0A7W7VST4_9ACTN|nr:hypothetical protein [Streptosporangium saharense]MBB4920969.1 hypothetical protein [Streptosporangium saharense]